MCSHSASPKCDPMLRAPLLEVEAGHSSFSDANPAVGSRGSERSPQRQQSGSDPTNATEDAATRGPAPNQLRRHSQVLMREASRTFTGGGAVLPPPERSSRQEGWASQSSQAMLAAVQAEMWNDIWERYRFCITLFFTFVLAFLFMMFFLLWKAVCACLFYNGLHCDQPLDLYLWRSFLVGQITPTIIKMLSSLRCCRSRKVRVALTILGSLPGWAVIAWGMHMVHACKTCQVENPNLFYSTKDFIYGQVALCVLTTIFYSIGFPCVLAYFSYMAKRASPGCEQVVHSLPKVEIGSPELLDPEDGKVIECPICTINFEEDRAVRTRCHHYFHEDCLARWCQTHVTCPICRGNLDDTDDALQDAATDAAETRLGNVANV